MINNHYAAVRFNEELLQRFLEIRENSKKKVKKGFSKWYKQLKSK